jgi:hypothetical protein
VVAIGGVGPGEVLGHPCEVRILLAHDGRMRRCWLGGRLTRVGRFCDVYSFWIATFWIAAFAHALLDEVLGYGLECDAGLEASYVLDIGFYYAGDDGVDDLERGKSVEDW